MNLSPARHAVALIATIAVFGALFRVATAPDRIKERNQTAQAVCSAASGHWTRLQGADVCLKPTPVPRP